MLCFRPHPLESHGKKSVEMGDRGRKEWRWPRFKGKRLGVSGSKGLQKGKGNVDKSRGGTKHERKKRYGIGLWDSVARRLSRGVCCAQHCVAFTREFCLRKHHAIVEERLHERFKKLWDVHCGLQII